MFGAYLVEWKLKSGGEDDWLIQPLIPRGSLSHQITNLEASTKYYVRISTVSNDVYSDTRRTSTITTSIFFVDLLLFNPFCSLTITMILKGAPFIYIYCYRGIDCE